MSTALEALRASKTADVTLPSGLNVTLRLPRLRDCVAAGDIPLSILAKLQASDQAKAEGKEPAELDAEEMRYVFRFNDEIARQAVIAIDGEPVELTLEDVQVFEDADLNDIVAYGLREKALPGKEG